MIIKYIYGTYAYGCARYLKGQQLSWDHQYHILSRNKINYMSSFGINNLSASASLILSIQNRRSYTGTLSSEMSGDSKARLYTLDMV